MRARGICGGKRRLEATGDLTGVDRGSQHEESRDLARGRQWVPLGKPRRQPIGLLGRLSDLLLEAAELGIDLAGYGSGARAVGQDDIDDAASRSRDGDLKVGMPARIQ